MLDFTRDVLAPLLVNQGKKVTRENLIKLAMERRERTHNGIWAEKLAQIIIMKPHGSFVISGIRFMEEVEVFRNRLKDDFRLVSVICSDRQRYERIKKRGTKGEENLTYEEFLEIEKKPTESIIGKTIETADSSVDNNGPRKDLDELVDELVKTLKR